MSDLEAALNRITTFDWAQNSLADYSLALVLFFLAFLGGYSLVNSRFLRFVSNFVNKTKNQFDDIFVQILVSIGRPFYFILGIYLASQAINVPEIIEVWISVSIVLIFTFYTANSIQKLAVYTVKKVLDQGDDGSANQSILAILNVATGAVIWGLALIYILSSFDINITALIGGLGVTSIAVAFALQNVLAEIFASLALYLDRPFQAGDFIIIGTDMGTVESIGLKSTKIQSLSGELLVVSNKELSEIRINNITKLQQRRIEFSLGVEYGTTAKQLRDIPDIVEKIVGELEVCEFDRAHFKSFGDSALMFEIVYFVNSPSYRVYMDAQQKINLEIKEALEREKINIAFPTQTIHLVK
jgi:small-conductance mechanosensitive channel